MKQALEYIITHLVDNKDAVKIEEAQEDGSYEYTISVAQEDMGKIIGKEGKIIRSIRNVLKIPAIKQNVHISIALADPSAA
jgi:predicted RNA-binding protein YlqC (UPF0109 family)